MGGSGCFAKQGKRDTVRLQGSKDTLLYAKANRGRERMSDVATMNKAAPTGSKGRLIIWVLLIVAVTVFVTRIARSALRQRITT